MKVTGGKYKGRNIESRPDRTVRPTSGRVREAMFNILKHGKFFKRDEFIWDDNDSLVEDRRVVDIFCGTGALGIEALSRGAAHITLIDQNNRILSMARQNVERLGEGDNLTTFCSDSTSLPKAPAPCHLIFIDPPYRQKLVKPALKSLVDKGWVEYGSVVVIEQGKKDDFSVPENFQMLDDRAHDITRIIVLQYTKPDATDA